MSRTIFLITFVSTLLWVEGSAFGDYYRQQFEDMDADHDHFVTWQEYRYYFLHARKAAFGEVDQNNDAKMGLFEWLEHKAKEDPTYKVKHHYHDSSKHDYWHPYRHGCWYDDEYGFWHDYWPGYPHGYGFGIGIHILHILR